MVSEKVKYIACLHVFMIRVIGCHEAVYCCFTRTTLFTKLFLIRVIGCYITSPSFVILHLLASEILPEAVYYKNLLASRLFITRTTLFSTMFTVILWCVH